MKLTKNQVERICSTLSVRRPCINCGYDGPVNGPMKAVNLESSVLTSNDIDITGSMRFLTFVCPKCGYTMFFNHRQPIGKPMTKYHHRIHKHVCIFF